MYLYTLVPAHTVLLANLLLLVCWYNIQEQKPFASALGYSLT